MGLWSLTTSIALVPAEYNTSIRFDAQGRIPGFS
jgi:hypothetical protein